MSDELTARLGRLDDQEFAARLRGARAVLRISSKEAGQIFGHSQQSMSRKESGEVSIPPSERFHFASVYMGRTGLPESWFTEPLDRLGGPAEDDDDLSPAEVVELVERKADGEDGASHV